MKYYHEKQKNDRTSTCITHGIYPVSHADGLSIEAVWKPVGKGSSSSQQSVNKQPEILFAGQKAVYKDFEIALLRAKATTEYINGPKEGNKYIVLRFKVKNISKEEKGGDVSRGLQWRDKGEGMRKGPASTTGVKLHNPKEGKLAPGAEAEFEAVYMVPNSLTEVEFHYIPGYDPIEKARWSLKIE